MNQTVAVGLLVWLALIWMLASAGVFAMFTSLPPRIPLAALLPVVVFLLVRRTRTFRVFLERTPLSWAIALQVFRVPVELVLLALHRNGDVPIQMTFEGTNVDIVTGLLAPFVALALARGWIGKAGAYAFHTSGLILLAAIVATALTSMPGPLHRPWAGVAPVVLASPPAIWLPTFLVPLALSAHLFSLMQLRRYLPAASSSSRPSARSSVSCAGPNEKRT